MGLKVVVNADDYGLLPEVNEAVIAAHQAGTLTSATLMVNTPASEDAVRLAHDNPRLGVGLHFTLTFGSSVTDPSRGSSLTDGSRRFLNRRQLLARAVSGRIRKADVAEELRAQLARMRGWGLCPTHIDGHQHVQVLPVVRDAVGEVAAEAGLRVRIPWVRWVEPRRRAPARLGLALLCRGASRSGLRATSAEFTSVFDYGDAASVSPALYGRMVRESGGDLLEIMVHPSFASSRLASIHPDIYEIALAEAAALTHPDAGPSLLSGGAGLTTFAPTAP